MPHYSRYMNTSVKLETPRRQETNPRHLLDVHPYEKEADCQYLVPSTLSDCLSLCLVPLLLSGIATTGFCPLGVPSSSEFYMSATLSNVLLSLFCRKLVLSCSRAPRRWCALSILMSLGWDTPSNPPNAFRCPRWRATAPPVDVPLFTCCVFMKRR